MAKVVGRMRLNDTLNYIACLNYTTLYNTSATFFIYTSSV